MERENPDDPFSRVKSYGRWTINLPQGTIEELPISQSGTGLENVINSVTIYADDETMNNILTCQMDLQFTVTY